MDILQLRYFCHAASTLSFAKTAQAFLVPASSISQCIKRIEKELNVPLFIRSANRIQLSPQGELFYKNVKNALDLLDSGVQTLRNSDSNKYVRICIGLRRVAVKRIIDQFKKKYSDAQISCEILSNPADGISPEGYDIIIAGENCDHPDYKRERLSHHKMLLFALSGMLSPDEITPEKLGQQVFISHPPGSYMYQKTMQLCQDLNISPQILTQEKYSVYFIIEEKRGIAFTSRPAFWPLKVDNYIDAFDVGEYYSDVFIYSKKETNSPYVISLIEWIKDEFNKHSRDLYNIRGMEQAIFPTALSGHQSTTDIQ